MEQKDISEISVIRGGFSSSPFVPFAALCGVFPRDCIVFCCLCYFLQEFRFWQDELDFLKCSSHAKLFVRIVRPHPNNARHRRPSPRRADGGQHHPATRPATAARTSPNPSSALPNSVARPPPSATPPVAATDGETVRGSRRAVSRVVLN